MRSRMKDIIGFLVGRPLLWLSREYDRVVVHVQRQDLRRALKACGNDFEIVPPWDIRGPEHISIGTGVFIGPEVLIIAGPGADVTMGNNIMFGPRVRVIPGSHKYDDPNILMKHAGPGPQCPIVIEDDVWIAAGATILGGVTLHRGSVIGAGAVVTRSVGAYEVWAGNPAKRIKDRFSSSATPSQAL